MNTRCRFALILVVAVTVSGLPVLSSRAAAPGLRMGIAASRPPQPGECIVGPPAPNTTVSSVLATAERPAGILTVCPDGPPTCDYAIIQDAVDAAGDGDVIKVATGVYTSVNNCGGLAQVVYISKTMTIRGGYTSDYTDPPDPAINPTTLDPQGQGRGIYITGEISATVEGLWITGGDATDLGGGLLRSDGGGGIYVISATIALRNNNIYGNIAGNSGTGGGLLAYGSNAILVSNTVAYNDAGGNGIGGGMFLFESNAVLTSNVITANTAESGGGLLGSVYGTLTLVDNIISDNIGYFNGGGLVTGGSTTLIGNTIVRNRTAVPGSGCGGGIHIGGGGSPILSNNTIVSNTATYGGGGLCLEGDAILTNNIIADNGAVFHGSGLYINDASPHLLHTTIVHNVGGDGVGVYVTDGGAGNPSFVVMSNTIIASQTVGVVVDRVAYNDTAVLGGVLWFGNESNTGGDGTIIVTHSITGNPSFLDAGSDNYHIRPWSAALDSGIDAGVNSDIDGDPRPMGHGYDIGADELRVSLAASKRAYPDLVQSGAQLTYTLLLTNTGDMTLTTTISDILPSHVTPTGILTWTAYLAPDDIWTEEFTVTTEIGYVGLLTNLVQAAAKEGATSTATCTVTVEAAITGLGAINNSPTVLGEATTLSATVASGSNVAYTWAFGDGTLGDGAVVTHIYPLVGMYTAVVTASNSVSMLTATTSVTVDEAIAGLSAVNDSPTPLGSPTALTVTIAAGTNVTCTWAFGDGGTSSGTAVTHTYPAVGVYNGIITASNSVSLLTASTVVTVDETIAGLGATNDSPTTLGNSTALTATVTAGSNIAYTWTFGDGAFGSGAFVSHIYSATGDYTAIVTASNSVGSVTQTTLVTIIQRTFYVYLPLLLRGW